MSAKNRPPVDCPNKDKLFGHCKFEARYDGVEPSVSIFKVMRLDANAPAGQVRYCRDICVRCGRTIERDDP